MINYQTYIIIYNLYILLYLYDSKLSNTLPPPPPPPKENFESCNVIYCCHKKAMAQTPTSSAAPTPPCASRQETLPPLGWRQLLACNQLAPKYVRESESAFQILLSETNKPKENETWRLIFPIDIFLKRKRLSALSPSVSVITTGLHINIFNHFKMICSDKCKIGDHG